MGMEGNGFTHARQCAHSKNGLGRMELFYFYFSWAFHFNNLGSGLLHATSEDIQVHGKMYLMYG